MSDPLENYARGHINPVVLWVFTIQFQVFMSFSVYGFLNFKTVQKKYNTVNQWNAG